MRGLPTSNWSMTRFVRADHRCSWATYIPRMRPDPSTTRDSSAREISAAGSTTSISWSRGRAKDIIIRNGENISPKEIEDILVGHEGIAEIAVVGIPDERTGERACAVIVTADQPAPALTDLRELLMRQGVAKFKIPEQVEIWDALPKNDAGKVLKHRIRAMLTKVDV